MYYAYLNDLSPTQYRSFIDYLEENQKTVKMAILDPRTSIQIWRENQRTKSERHYSTDDLESLFKKGLIEKYEKGYFTYEKTQLANGNLLIGEKF